MQGMTPKDNVIWDSVTGAIGSVAWPFVRYFWRQDIKAHKAEHTKRELPPWPRK